MAFVPHTYVIPWDVAWYWGCVPLPEQAASEGLAALSILGVAVAPADPIDLFFAAASPLWFPRRIAAWKANWGVREETIVIDEVEVRVYTCDREWVALLAVCALSGACPVGDDDCPSRPVYSA